MVSTRPSTSKSSSPFIIIIIIITIWEIFTPTLADGLSIESEGKQVSSRLLESF